MRLPSYPLLVFFGVLSIIGLALVPRLSVQLAPSVGGRQLTIRYSWLGAGPVALERQITAPLEGAVARLPGIQKISSLSDYGQGYITLELDPATKADAARFEVAAVVRQVYSRLPTGVSYPQISRSTPDDTQTKPLLTLQLSGPDSPGTLQRYAEEQLQPQLASVADVGQVAVYGGTPPEWRLTYNPYVLSALQLTKADLLRAVKEHFRREPLGQLRANNGYTLRVGLDNAVGDTEGWSTIPVARRAGRIVQLGNVVMVKREEPSAQMYYRINGKTTVNVVVSAVAGANQLRVAGALRQQIAALSLPSGYQLAVEEDTTVYIRDNLHQLGIQTGVAVLVLLAFVSLITRSKRYIALIVSSTVVTLLLSGALFVALRVEVHLYSLAALTTSLGLIMDNVIIMIDHYWRYRDRRVFTALLGATLTTCAGLVVVWFLPEVNRQALTDFALVMIVTLAVSLSVSVGFVPAVMEQFWRNKSIVAHQSQRTRARLLLRRERIVAIGLTALLRVRGALWLGALLLFGLPMFWLPDKIADKNPLAPYYNATLGSEWYGETVKPLLNRWLGGTLQLFINYVYEGSYPEEPERTALFILAELPTHSTPVQMDAVFRQLEAHFSRYVEIDRFVTRINNGQEGSMVVYFREPYDKGSFPFELKSQAMVLSTEMSGIDWEIYGVGQGFSQRLDEEQTPTFSIMMQGYNYRLLEEQARLLAQQFENHPRVQSVNINRSPGPFQRRGLTEFVLQTNPERLALGGISPTALYDNLATFNAQPPADFYAFINGDYEAVTLLPDEQPATDLWALTHRPLQIGSVTLALNQAATINRQPITPQIHRENQQYKRVVSFNYFGSYPSGEKFLKQTLTNFRPMLPLGNTATVMDQSWFGDDPQIAYWLIALVVVLIYLICAVIFEDLWQPFALIGLIPLSYVGVFLAFYWTDSNFDQGGYASFVLLAGNVVCAGIFIVAEMNRLRQKFPRLSPMAAYQKAFRHKIGPVLLTVLSTVVGMIPFLFYDREPFWYALGVGTIGGLLMSLLAVVIWLPVFLLRRPKMPLIN